MGAESVVCPDRTGARAKSFIPPGAPGSSALGRLQHPAAHLVELDRLEQRLEVAFAEALVAFALDELEEDRPELVLGEDLQQ
jgi:hypothetical protein